MKFVARTIQAFSKKSGKERDGYEYVAHLVTRRTAKLENALPASLMELALGDKISENSSRPCRPFVNLINAFCRLSIAPGPLPFGFFTGWAGARDSALLNNYRLTSVGSRFECNSRY